MTIKTKTFERTELYKKVWQKPLTELTDEYGVTYHGLSKVCKKLNIPTPPSGYWTKVRYGKEVKQKPLPEHDQKSYTLRFEKKINIDIHKKLPKDVQPISINKKLYRPDPLIKRTHDYLKNEQPNTFNRIQTMGKNMLDVSIFPDNLNRAMRILDTIIKALKRQKFTIITEQQNRYSKSYLKLGENHIYFKVREKGYRKKKTNVSKKEKQRWDYHDYEYFSTGKLELRIFDSIHNRIKKTIRDTKSKPLEEQLDKFFPYLFEVAEKKERERKRINKWHQQLEKERQLEQDNKKQKKHELERQRILEERADAFTKSHYIYKFIAEIENQKDQLELSKKEIQKIDGWVRWATKHAKRLDPIQKTIDSILNYS